MSIALNVKASPQDVALLNELMEGSPFSQEMLLAIALRIGLKSIKQDPTVLLPYVAKSNE